MFTYKNASRQLSDAEKDALFPTIYFQFLGTGKVPFRPSAYLLPLGPATMLGAWVRGTDSVFIGNAAESLGQMYTGVLGNAWLNRMLVQVRALSASSSLVCRALTVAQPSCDLVADVAGGQAA